MISLALAAVLNIQGRVETVTLVRGGTVHGLQLWDYSDTTLESSAPNANLGGDAVLSGGPARTILLRFGDVDRVVRPNQRVRKASLVFTITGGGNAGLKSAGRLLVGWGEGPYQTLSEIVTSPAAKVGTDLKKPEEPSAARGSATWRMRQSGEGNSAWQQAGATGPADVAKIDGAKMSVGEKEARIDGLEGAVQEMADHPFANFGFALSFDAPLEVGSGQGANGRPRLELELEDATPTAGPDLSVVAIERRTTGDPSTFVAHIKNVGSAASGPFTATWFLDDRPGAPQDVATKLAPGEETTLSTSAPSRGEKGDHRFGTVALRIHPSGADINPRNDGRLVYGMGRPIEVVVSRTSAGALQPESAEDWVQKLVRRFNDVYLAQSRFSFAPEGATERLLVQRVIVSDQMPTDPPANGATRVMVSTPEEMGFLRSLATAIGVPDFAAENVAPEANEFNGRGGGDRFPGLMGYGDTRFEGLIPGSIALPYEPYSDPLVDSFPPEPTGLLSATDVATLNAALGGPAVVMPRTALLQFKTQGGEPLANAEISVYQTQDGKLAKDAKPKLTLKTSASGTALLPLGETGPFASIDPKGGNGALLLTASVNGVTEGSWIKAWQLIDDESRSKRTAAFINLRLALPTAPLETGTNLTTDRIVTDSTGALPAKLAALIDGDNTTEATLGAKAGDWVEIDLGRDRTIGEVDLIAAPGSPWTKFDLMSYATGQRPEEAQPWVREIDARWSFRNRREVVGQDRVLVAYRGAPRRFRYLRIINRGSEPGKLAEIKVIPAKVAQ